MNFIAVLATDKGNKNSINEDSAFVRTGFCRCGNICIAAVCDGVGGMEAGEHASSHMVLSIMEWFDNNKKYISSLKMAVCAVKNIIVTEGRKIYEEGVMHDMKSGTTVSVLIICNGRYGIVHVGDSRIYKITPHASCLTKDHVLKGGVLTQCAGMENIHPQIRYGLSMRGSIFLICSDGFRHKNTIRNITSYYKKVKGFSGHYEYIRLLMERCRSLGETDDVTAVVVRCV